MKIVELTKEVAAVHGEIKYVKAYFIGSNIIYFHKCDTGSIIQTVDGDRSFVLEDPESIAEMIWGDLR